MIHVSPRDMERFYLRVLLCHRNGPKSYEDPRTVGGTEVCATFRDAALRLGYFESDAEWVSFMTEAADF